MTDVILQEAHDIKDILHESLEHEKAGLQCYQDLLEVVRDDDNLVFLDEYARQLITEEEMHIGDVEKMLKKPG